MEQSLASADDAERPLEGPSLEGPSLDGPSLEAGQRLGEWVLEAPLGRGAFAAVWRARHAALEGRRVALKVPHDPAFAARLHREGRLLEKVSGPQVVGVVGLDPDHDPPYLVMELVEGESLRDRLEREARLEPAEARRILLEIARGLALAHAAGVIHRDLKPANVLLDQAGGVRVADFGLGRLNEAATQELLASGSLRTQEGTIVGTLRYMAPEQRDPQGEVDARADLYALGVILFELLTGEAPCGGEVVSDVRPELDPAWDDLYRELCARREKRLESAAAAIDRLERVGVEPVGPDPVEAGAARSVAVPAGLFARWLAFSIDALPFVLLALGPLRAGRGLPALLAFLLYDLAATVAFGRTAGKFFCGLRVVNREGGRVEGARAFQREALRLLSLASLGLGYLPALIPGLRAFHDTWADTQVVHD